MMLEREKLVTIDDSVRGTHIGADLLGDTYVTLVDYWPGSRLEEKLKTLEHKLDHIFAMLMEIHDHVNNVRSGK